ncbi:hypothetical protein HGRIS_012049 [Hohenbuehelia grisea]|uniref:F-box domain-containing protein n=1 Tax=Hohenbuehelia grisea TaxID=104357 RepID=A0ABR3IR28_9AGAR
MISSHPLLSTISRASRVMDLPPEIIDMIVDHCHADKGTLLNLSLLARRWTASSRFHLFHGLTVRLDPQNLQAFSSLFDSPFCSVQPLIQRISYQASFKYSDDLISHLSAKGLAFPSVTNIDLQASSFEADYTSATPGAGVPSPLSVIFPNVRHLSLDKAFISCLSDFCETLDAFSNLERLSIGGTFLSASALGQCSTRRKLKRALDVELREGNSERLQSWILSSGFGYDIVSFGVVVSTEATGACAARFINEHCESLRRLNITFTHSYFLYQYFMDHVDFSRLLNLSSLTIGITPLHYPQLDDMIQTILSPLRNSRLETFTTHLLADCTLVRHTLASSEVSSWEDTMRWDMIDSLFKLPNFPCLSVLEMISAEGIPQESLTPVCASRGIHILHRRPSLSLSSGDLLREI